MKKITLFISFLFFSFAIHAQSIIGAWESSSTSENGEQLRNVIIFANGYQVLSKEENSRLAARQTRFINNLENALVRIENKSYGICRVTGKLIAKERLKAVPHATLSIDAKLAQSNPEIMN